MTPAEAKRREALERRTLAMQSAYGSDVRQIVSDAFNAGKDTGWEDRGVHDERISAEKPDPVVPAPVPTVPATPIKPAERITPEQLIADGQVVRETIYANPTNYRRKVVIPGGTRNAIEIHKPGRYMFEDVYAMDAKSGFVTPANMEGKCEIVMRRCGAIDIDDPKSHKAQGAYFHGCKLDIDGWIASNIEWHSIRPLMDESHGIYTLDCTGRIENVLADRVQFSGAAKRSSSGPGKSGVTVANAYVTRCGAITDTSVSFRGTPEPGWHVESDTLKVGGEALGRWIRQGDELIWAAWGVMLRGLDADSRLDGLYIGPTRKNGHGQQRQAASDINSKQSRNIHAGGWGNLAAPSLLPGGMSDEEWGIAIRGGYREELLPEVIR